MLVHRGLHLLSVGRVAMTPEALDFSMLCACWELVSTVPDAFSHLAGVGAGVARLRRVSRRRRGVRW